MPDNAPLIRARGLTCVFGRGKRACAAVDKVDFDIGAGEVISIVGESGSGKTTLARIILQLQRQTAGELLFDGRPARAGKQYWQQVQAVFQDPFASFNQFFTVGRQLRDALALRGRAGTIVDIEQALRQVNLEPSRLIDTYPFELSGGQMQRLLIARAFLLRPRVLIADEPTSMVDACSRAQILDALMGLREALSMTVVFITHDIGLAYHVSDRIFVMRQGAIVEQGDAETVIGSPAHPYTRRLLADIPVLHRRWLDTDETGAQAAVASTV